MLKARAATSPTVGEIAWAAGLFEGEGWSGAHDTIGHAHLVIAQKDRWVLDRMAKLFGGRVWTQRNGMSYWRVGGARAIGVAFTLFSFLSPRRRQQIKAMLSSVHTHEEAHGYVFVH